MKACHLNTMPAKGARLLLPLLLSALLPLGAGASDLPESADIRRTADDIPHIRAGNWRDLGRGIGYAQAEDALCTLAEGFLTYAGQRSREFGGDGRPAANATFGRPTNRELDFFFRAFATPQALRAYQHGQPAELNALAEGFAAGYNHYLSEVRNGRTVARHRACLEQKWVEPISADDVYRRMLAAQWAGGLAHFIPQIVAASSAVPVQEHRDADAPAAPVSSMRSRRGGAGEKHAAADLRRRLQVRMGDAPSLGSNAMAFGQRVTGEGQSVLFGNPHWYWSGPDRFYQMHLTIPGKLDVAGVGFLGVPMVMLGFNDQVAWTHTVSMARRFSLYALRLDEGHPQHYRVGESRQRLAHRRVSIEVRGEDGRIRTEQRTFALSGVGPLVDLGDLDPALKNTGRQVFALRDVNVDNAQVFAQYLAWGRASSLAQFIDIQRRMLAMPWVNTVAIGRGEGRVWYADMGAVPAERNAWASLCTVQDREMQKTMEDIGLPILDGSRSLCLPGSGVSDPVAARLQASEMPSQLRPDYVANMNNSYWLTNANAPMTGFPDVMGGEPDTLTLRARYGHELALAQLARPATSARALGERLAEDLLVSSSLSAKLYRAAVVEAACPGDDGAQPAKRDAAAPNADDPGVRQACAILSDWTGDAEPGSRGTLLWEAVWREFMEAAEKGVKGVPSVTPANPADPLKMPGRISLDAKAVRVALRDAVAGMRAAGLSPDAALSSTRMVSTVDGLVPQFGGCEDYGYFMVFCDHGASEGGIEGNAYLQLVHFADDGVHARTLLAHGQDEDALTPVSQGMAAEQPVADGEGERGSVTAPLVRYAQRRWLAFPFTEADIGRTGVVSHVELPAAGGHRR